MKIIVIIYLLFSLYGCAILGSPHTFAICSAADVGSTIVALESGLVEANPIMNAVIGSGDYPLLIAVNAVVIWLIYRYHKKEKEASEFPIAAGSILRCGAAVHNVLLI